MGNSAAQASAELDNVALRTSQRVGNIPVTGRFHSSPRCLEDDYHTRADDVVGKGMNGAVYKAWSKQTKRMYAVKDFSLKSATEEELEDLRTECEIFLSMDHPHVARLTDVYKSNDKLSLVMELMEGGELFDRITKKKQFTEKDAADAAYQMLLAVNYIHSHGIVHRDLKLENFLYEKKDTDHLKLIDFGFGKMWNPSIRMKMSCGTLSYVAPEVLNKSYDNKCDLWSFGVVVFILITGYMPFPGSDQNSTIRRIKTGEFLKKDGKWTNVSPAGKDFIKKLLCVNPSIRMSAEEALKHPFIKDRSELAKHAAVAKVNDETVEALIDFSHASKFRKACMSLMAWSLTNEERRQLRDAFLAMDKNKSGTITLGDFKKTMQQIRPSLSSSDAKAIFDNLHASCTDEIAYSDFLAAMVSSRVNFHDDLLRTTFSRFDADHNGYIDANELKDALGEEYEGEDVASMMREADLNNDGRISLHEFITYAKGDGHREGEENKVALLAGSLIEKELSRKDTKAVKTSACRCLPCLSA